MSKLEKKASSKVAQYYNNTRKVIAKECGPEKNAKKDKSEKRDVI